jgi:hypothetical protein
MGELGNTSQRRAKSHEWKRVAETMVDIEDVVLFGEFGCSSKLPVDLTLSFATDSVSRRLPRGVSP